MVRAGERMRDKVDGPAELLAANHQTLMGLDTGAVADRKFDPAYTPPNDLPKLFRAPSMRADQLQTPETDSHDAAQRIHDQPAAQAICQL